jgi:membrane-bound lytic murein transglycosylase B
MVSPRTVIATVIAVVVALSVVVIAVLVFLAPDAPQTATSSPRATTVTFAPLPTADPAVSGPNVVDAVDAAWVARVSAATSIPTTALKAYAGVTVEVSRTNPTCELSWNTLAGIGWVESRHGMIHGTTLGADGTLSPPLYGVALDGNGVAHIPDSDGGTLDGDASGDRAIGPMQFLPGSWRNWHVDANGDGVENPQNIFDATMAAANYLCRAAGTLGTQDGWQRGILSYNSSRQYLGDVMDAANRYASLAKQALTK